MRTGDGNEPKSEKSLGIELVLRGPRQSATKGLGAVLSI